MRRLLLGAALVIASIALVSCEAADEDEDGGAEATTATTETTATESGGEERATEIARFTFETPLEVAVGTTVTWTNTEEPHTVTARDGSFDSGRIPQGESFSHTFRTAGTFDYFCQVHPAMEGRVVVE